MDINKSIHTLKGDQNKTVELTYIPHKYSIAITSKCNLRCTTCLFLLQNREYFKNKGFMAIEDYKRMLLKYRKHIDVLSLAGGEPLMHPQLEELVDFAISLNISVGFATNGVLIKDNLGVCKKVNGFRISLDAYDSATYRKNRGGTEKEWNDILDGIQLLKENNIKYDISFLISRTNIQEIFKMLDLADILEPSWVNFNSFNPHRNDNSSVLIISDDHVSAIFSKIMQKIDYDYDITLPYIFNDQSVHHKFKVCDYPWFQVSAQEDGFVAYCCHMEHDQRIGNIFEDYDFNSPMMQSWRQQLLKHKLPNNCTYCHRRFQGEYTTYNKEQKIWENERLD